MAQKKNSKVLKKVPEDHASCIRVSQSELLVDHDAELLDIEGDPLEEFEVTKSDKVDKVIHSRCTLAWQETWEDSDDKEEEELKELLRQ
eukprot:10538.XXX_281485_281028_1 [CDS] Oithona nana genome sequencing.